MLPNRFGLMFTALIFVLLLAAINYNNGLAFGLTFLLASIAIVSMVYTHNTLSGLHITAGPQSPVFAGQTARFALIIHNRKATSRYGLQLEYEKKVIERFDVHGNDFRLAKIPVTTHSRGWVPSPTFCLSTIYPFGILYSWSRKIKLDQRYLVYPTPASLAPDPPDATVESGDTGGNHKGQDDFYGLRSFQKGDSPRHVSWKTAARGQGMYTKEFNGANNETVWLDWQALPQLDIESRLSILCRWVLDAESQYKHYGLKLPGHTIIKPARGPEHQHVCLKVLALYPGHS
ncbi:MAG: DUF58 domain-containing protein [Gammaproteobacteria bacterium]|nr:DUF58 domain-containing protein [Gammaproteobacteria bacterium]